MTSKSRSNKPLALSVAFITEPGNVQRTVDRMLDFDGKPIPFSHAKTWAAMPEARRGKIKSTSAGIVAPGTHSRVAACIKALFELGERAPVETLRFTDFPQAGLRTSRAIEWAPTVTINVHAVCWHNVGSQPIIPLLQPRLTKLPDENLSLYATISRQAYCTGDWSHADIEVVDLSGDQTPYAKVIASKDIGEISEKRVREFVETYIEAKAIADRIRSAHPKPKNKPKGEDLFSRL